MSIKLRLWIHNNSKVHASLIFYLFTNKLYSRYCLDLMYPLHETTYSVFFEHVDLAKIVFYAHYFFWMHQIYEAWIEKHQPSIEVFIQNDIFLPIINTKCSYKHSLSYQDKFKIQLFCRNIQEYQFTLEYQFYRKTTHIATAETTHLCINKQKERILIPPILRSILD